MSFSQLPPELISDIIRHLVQLDSWTFEAMQYRSVNRLFNEEILLNCFVLNDPRQTWKKNYVYSGYSNNTMAKRRVQGLLARREKVDADNSPWLSPLVEAISVLDFLLSQSEYRDEAVRIHQQKNITQSSIFCDPASSMVCESFVGYHECLIDAILNVRRVYFDRLDVSTDFWILAGACHGGSISLIRNAIEHVQLNYTEDWRVHASKFLGSVVRDGKEEVIRYLISLGVGANTGNQHDMTAFVAAAHYRRLDILRVLFEPQYNLSINNEQNFTSAISHVAMTSDPAVRLDTVQFLIAQAGHHLSLEARSEVFFIACCFNDIALAELMLDKGPVDLYRHYPVHTKLTGQSPRFSALYVVAERGHLACLRLILRSKFTPDRHEERSGCFCNNRVWRSIHDHNRLEMFKDMIPYMDERCGGPERIYLRGAQLQGGLVMVEDLKGPYDLTKLLPNETTPLGVTALRIAAIRAVLDNVEYLLKKGIRTEDEILVEHGTYEKHMDKFDKVNEVLTRFGNPGLRRFVRREVDPPPWYRHLSYDYDHIN